METGEKVISLADYQLPTRAGGIPFKLGDHSLILREARGTDVSGIQELYLVCYDGKYHFDYVANPVKLREDILDRQGHVWLVAESPDEGRLVGAVTFVVDRANRLAKAAGAVILNEFRGVGLGTMMLKTGVYRLTEECGIDVIYATTRTVNVAPSRMVEEVGFHQMGLFPNAVQMETLEHLNLDVYLTKNALDHRRKRPYLFPAFADVYGIVRDGAGLEKANLVTERAPLKLSPKKIQFRVREDESEAVKRFSQLASENRIANRFFPLHTPNRIFVTDDGGTEVFVAYGGPGKQSAILGYRTDQVNLHDLYDAVALQLQRMGAGYVEMLVDAYNYMHQQAAFTARFIPSAYFPAMKLNIDGLRDDFFVLSRTFHLLDFTNIVVSGESLKFLRAYLHYYHELYLKPILGPEKV